MVPNASEPLREVDVEETSLGHQNIFGSEFGAVVMSSFESMAPTLGPQHWGLHGGQKKAIRWGATKGGHGKMGMISGDSW